MAIADDLKKTLADPTPLYFAAGTADIALEQAKKVPGLIEQLRVEAPVRFEAVKNTDPKIVQQKAREAQEVVTSKVAEVLGTIDARKIGETAQDLAMRGVGVAAEYAVKAKETYDRVAERGEQAVREWRGDVSEEIVDIAVAVEPDPQPAAVDGGAGAAQADDRAASRRTTTRKTPAKKAEESVEG
ncbi:hypothetical protein C0216_29075 [Streptomyces globosus]|uniref:Uncharacterized protein n=1 Tax=Streptomyces globosus TaxID=68209 RepID=A0A344U7R8_9ACTN|nr:hypothetical protein [Streptomyces globosus]AXE26939.1 hypothetical protein C0216_29075 [Streptomyces globosus]